jgi:uncharacterized membrane protein
MPKKEQKTVICPICKEQKKLTEMLPGEMVREPVALKIKMEYPDWSNSDFICISDLNRFRAEYVQQVIETDKGELSALEKQVIESMKEQELLAANINVEYDRQLTGGERMADKLADFGGSWRFIGIFAGVMFLWIALNSSLLVIRPFDPYPYIFLNLILSCVAAIQAPIIMMSQNRQESRDRLRSEHDYRINLKAELEIRNLHEKMDHLLVNQWQRLINIQEIQMELMEEIVHKPPRK